MLHSITNRAARRIWLEAQRLDTVAPFGAGPEATRAAVEHLGYVQIDTINVIERCHHHILFTRIPSYRRADLQQAQAVDKSVFEYWTHALSYVPTRDLAFYLPAMRRFRADPHAWYGPVSEQDRRRVLALLRRNGPLTIRDIDDDVLVEKSHPWASRKPSKKALQLHFYAGKVTVAERVGMLKTYELTDRHFGWEKPPKPATEAQFVAHLLERALRSQGLISLDSACYGDAKRKPALQRLIEVEVRRRRLVPVAIEGTENVPHWSRPDVLERHRPPVSGLVHILSPFDPLIIQRKRLEHVFGYAHRFEAYLPRPKRVLGYFALPVLVGDEIVAALDLKCDRKAGCLMIQQWTWISQGHQKAHKRMIEEELGRFERFQLADAVAADPAVVLPAGVDRGSTVAGAISGRIRPSGSRRLP